jgi:cobalt-zinc-cadmium efflux system protein
MKGGNPDQQHDHQDGHSCDCQHGHSKGHSHGQQHSHQGHHHSHDHHSQDHHSHDHHGHHGHHHGIGSDGNKIGLAVALSITLGIMILEFFGGLFTNSLALLSDSGHMLSDAASLALSLLALWIASKPASPSKTYGYHRFEILAALFNGVTLFVIAGWIIWKAYGRLMDPPTVASGSMMLIAMIGLLANLSSAWALLRKGDVQENLNLRSAYLHILGDALGSVGAIAAGLLMWAFSWYAADPIISVLVALLILKSAWSIINHTSHILMEGTPSSVNHDEVMQTLESITGVKSVHDLHIWTITSGLISLSCHLLIEDYEDNQKILQEAIHQMEQQFQIQHSTIQIETTRIQHGDMKV